MQLPAKMATFRRLMRRCTSSFLPLVLAVSTLSAVSVVTAPSASALTAGSGNCAQTYTVTGSGQVDVFESSGYCYVAFKNTGAADSQATYSWTRPTGLNAADVLVVGGGGGGGARHGGGGGGGGFVQTDGFVISAASSISIAVGAGGGASTSYSGTAGQSSYFKSSTNGLTALGGGFGANAANAGSGGSGGGAGASQTPGGVTAATQTTFSGTTISSINFGNSGAAGASDTNIPADSNDYWAGGGGGGAGGAGETPRSNGTPVITFPDYSSATAVAGKGGVGKSVSWITPTIASALTVGQTSSSTVYFAGGGGGGMGADGQSGGPGGLGGGATGTRIDATGNPGTAFTGGGGGGSGFRDINKGSGTVSAAQAGAGGSGVVLIRYANTYTVTYNYNGADGGNGTLSNNFTTGGTPTTLPVPTKTNFIFDGWYEAADFTGSALGSTYSPTQSRTIYAKWVCTPSTTTSGGYTYLAFKTVGVCSWTSPIGITVIDLLVVAGGGGGASRHAGGGGAGGLINATSLSINGSAFTITVGAGGAGGAAQDNGGTGASSGAPSSVSGGGITSRTAIGGGGGGYGGAAGSSGGSGGGGGNGGAGGTATSVQGSDGSAGASDNSNYWVGGGGGGAGGKGTASQSVKAGSGGAGLEISWIPTAVGSLLGVGTSGSTGSTFAGGGGGGSDRNTIAGGNGGVGGGAPGSAGTATATSGTANTGGGGGGSGISGVNNGSLQGGGGGSGVVIVKFVNAPSISLSSSSISASVGSAVTSYTISNSSGPAASYSISPSLAVAGLTFSTSTGKISGTPTAVVASASYMITATNTSGTSTATFSISTSYSVCSPSSVSSGGFTILTFSSVLSCNWSVPAGVTKADVLVVGGGGGGSGNNSTSSGTLGGAAGGGGGGGAYLATAVSISDSITVVIGAGGAGGSFSAGSTGNSGQRGATSSFGTISAGGGGAGGCETSTGNNVVCPTSKMDGASGTAGGGGGGATNYWNAYNWGAGGTGSSVTIGGTTYAAQNGFRGGYYNDGGTSGGGTAGPGGGARSAGNFNTPGSGLSSTITGSTVEYGKGGSAYGVSGWSFRSSTSGYGTGGDGAFNNTSGLNGASGAQGIVIVKYINAPSISLSTSTISATVGSAVTSYSISNSGGTADSYSISPSLAISGLTFSTSTGQISGTPTAAVTAASYTITATNTSGTSTATFSIVSSYAACSPTSTTSNGYTILTFSSVATCGWTTPAGISAIEVAVIGGGGGGGFGSNGGGGGAGEVLVTGTATLSTTTVTNTSTISTTPGATTVITIGGGGTSGAPTGATATDANWTAQSATANFGGNGTASSFGAISAGGGGGGGGNNRVDGGQGGSGGGAATAGTAGAVGSNSTPSGWSSFKNTGSIGSAGSGGGAGGLGSSTKGGFGVTIWGTKVAGGGGGWGKLGSENSLTDTVLGGNGRLSTGNWPYAGTAPNYTSAGVNGTGTGGGGGAPGGSGAVIIRYASGVSYTYDANNGTGTAPAGGSAQGGTSFTTAANPYSRNGYTFSGWNTAANGTGTALTASASNTMPISASAVVFYAQWSANSVAITTPSIGLTGTVGTGYSLTLSTSGGSGSGTFSIASGSLPAGVTLNSSTGVISGTPTASGTFAITARITDSNTAVATTSAFSIVISLATRTLAIDAGSYTSTYTMVATPPTLTATASAGTGAKSFTSSTTGVCTVNSSSGLVAFVSVGTCTITASITADSTYASATSSSISFTTTAATQTVTWAPTTTLLATSSPATPSAVATALGSATISYAVTSAGTTGCTVNSSTGVITFTTAGSCEVTATAAATSSYATASRAVTFVISLASRTLTIDSGSFTSTYTMIATPPTLTSTASAGTSQGTKSYSSSTALICTVNSSTGLVAFVSAGTCTLSADISAGTTYAAATSASISFTTTQLAQTITRTSTSPVSPVKSGTYTPTATASSTLTVAITIASGSASVCSIAAGLVAFDNPGSCIIQYNQSGNTNYSAAAQVTETLTIGKLSQTITFGSLSNRTLGSGTVSISATTTSSLAVSFTSATSGICTVASGVITLVAAGTCTINADQAGDGNYLVATQVQRSFTVAAVLSITTPSGAALQGTYNTAFTSLTISSTGGAGTKTFSATGSLPAGVTLSSAGVISGTPSTAGDFSLTVTVTDANGVTATTSSFMISIAKGVSTVSLSVPTYTYTGSAQGPDSVTKSGSSGAVTYAYAGRGSTTYASSSTKPTSAGTYTVTATVAADSNFALVIASANFEILAASLVITPTISASSMPYGTVTGSLPTIGFSKSLAVTLTTDPTCALYLASDTGYATVKTLSSTLAVGSYVVNCKNAVLQNYAITYGSDVAFSVTKLAITQPNAPNVSATAGVLKSLAVSWTAASNATSYNLKMYASDGTTLLATISVSSSTSKTVTASDYSSIADGTNYKFSMTAVGDATYADSIASALSSAVTTNSTYIVTYSYNSADGGASTVSDSFITGGTAITLPVPTRTGYAFAGWFEAIGLTGSALATTYSPTQTRTIYAKWSANTNTVVFNSNTGSGTMADQSITTAVSTSLASNTFTKAGYTFAGWNTNADGTSGTSFTNGQAVTLTAGMTVYAKWTSNSLTVTFDSQSGSAVTSGSVNTGASIPTAPTAPTRSGYSFSGWSATPTGSVITFPYAHGQTASFSLYAIWSANALTVIYDSQGGSAVTSGSVNTGASITSAPTAPTRSGYTLSGWSATTTGAVITFPYAHGQTANFTLYAIWSANALTVTYDSQGGSAVSSGSVNTGASISAAPTAPTRSGYSFSGWSTTSTGSVITFPYAHGQTVNFTLYAIWSANALTVTYDSKGGSAVTSGSVNTGASISAAPTAPTRAGYTLSGWSTTDTGTVLSFPYAHGQTASFTLYAIWSANALTVTYDSQGGSAVTAGSVNTGASISAAPTAPTRSGYTFSGWSATPTGSVITFPYTHGQTANFNLYAKWSANGNTVLFNNNTGSGTMADQSITTAVSTALSASTFTKTGYSFAGWNTNADGISGTSYSDSQTVTLSAGMTIYAKWSANTYVVTYNYNGATADSATATSSFTTGGTVITLPTPAKTGYTFAGWYSDSGFTTSIGAAGASYSPTTSPTAYAKWTANTNTVTFNSNDGSGTPTTSTQSIVSGAATALIGNTFTRTGYSFAGWTAAANGTGTSYTDSQTVTITSGMTIYAKWSANVYNITYAAGTGGSGTAPLTPSTAAFGTTFTTPANTFTKTGFTFAGWNDGTSNYLASVTYPASGTVSGNVTLTATWTGNICSPTSSTSGGYTRYTFTSTTTCFWDVPAGVSTVDVLAVGGGSGGGYAWDNTGAGGGAGGQVVSTPTTLSGTVTVTVGQGGAGGTTTSKTGSAGTDSSIGSVTARAGTGGCAARSACSITTQATALTGAVGGAGGIGGASGKGGGGSSTVALAPTSTIGGTGTSSSYSGSSITYGTGGAGGAPQAYGSNIAGAAASANTGNGGGGASAKNSSGDVNGGVGGSGLIIVRVANANAVVFDANTGTGTMTNQSIISGVATALTSNTLTKTGYAFGGWNTNADGTSGTSYTNGQSVTITAGMTLFAKWTLNTYAITFNANNGSGSMGNQSISHGVATGLNANLFTRANYVFYRWATAADGSGTTYNNLASATLTAGTTLYAQWTPNTYVVTYNYESATGGASTASASFTTAGSAIVLPTPTKTGYTFSGWYSDLALTSSIGAAGAGYSPTGTSLSLNAYAKWSAINYIFTYDANSADTGSVPTETTKQITQTATVKANTGSLVRVGYTFNGWNTASDGTGTNYLSGSQFTVASSNVILYAKWSANTYTVTYNANGGTGSAQRSASTVTTDSYTTGGASIALPGVGTLERAGYTFGGWNTSAAGTGTNRIESDLYTTISDVTFYAKWNAVTYSITYNGNSSDGGSTPTTGGYTTGQASPYLVLANTFTKTAGVFGGWNTAANGSGTNYSPGASITTLAAITLYAIWIPQYTLHYAINGGTVSSGSLPGDTLYTTGTSVGPVFSSLSRTGYTFDGWVNGATTVALNGYFTILADSVLTAKWTAINYTISYNSDGGTDGPAATTKQIGQSYTIGSAVIKPGYNFTGWWNGSSLIGADAVIIMGSSNVTYTAQWVAKVYRVSYDWNGGRGTAVGDVSYTYGTAAITLPLVGDRTKDGYTFAGWSESPSGSLLNATYIPSQSRTLYALWNIGNFTITYDAGRGTVANPSVPVLNGGSTTLPLPTRTNFVFNGWHTSNSGGTALGSNGASFTPTSSQTVYARWIQSSLYGISDSLSRIGSVVTADNVANTFSGANSNSSVSVSVPANTFAAGTTINFELVGSSSRAVGLLPNVNYLISIAVSWLTGDETVPETASGKPVSITISNATIKAGASAYAIINNVSTLLGTATQDGSITVSITSDPEIVIAATKPDAPINVTAASNGNQQVVVSWNAPTSNGGAAITTYTVTANTGATCTSSTTSCTISGLSNGTTYTFTVTATNTVGTSVASSSASATTASLYSVTFNAKGGTTVTSGTFLTAASVVEPTAPTRTGYVFAGWSATDGGSAEYFPYSPNVTNNITMYARWDALDNAVTFNSKSGSTVADSTFPSGGTVAAPTAPTRSGYTFAGWSAIDGGSVIAFPYSPGVVTDITLFAKWNLVSSGSSGSASGSANTGSNNAIVVAPVTVTGNKAAQVPTVEISVPVSGSSSKPVGIKIDSASEKFIASAKVIDGKLVLTPETGFSGKKSVTVTITENGVDRMIQIPITVLPEVVSKPVLTPVTAYKSLIKWAKSENANTYSVYLDGKRVCATTANSCAVPKILGPDATIEIVSNGGDRTVSEKIEADFKQAAPIEVSRVFSATNTKIDLSQVDTKSLDKVVSVIKAQGFTTVMISKISTTKKTEMLATARIAAIQKYIEGKVGTGAITFQVVAPTSRTYFNKISLKG